MSNLKGTKTEQNLMTAFAGESMARNKYTYYAAKAQEEGYEQIANVFLETARNEMEHAKLWYKLLHDGEVADTMTNLKDAAAGENGEWTDMYARFAEVAREEGLNRIAVLFEMVGKIVIAFTLVPHLGYTGVIIAEPIVWFVMVIPLIVQIFRMPVLKQTSLS